MIARTRLPSSSARVLLIGGDDVDARIELMQSLSDEFMLAAAGTSRALGQRFSAKGFQYFYYPLGRGSDPFRDGYALRALWRVLRHYRPHIVHTFDTKPCVYGRLLARLARVHTIVGTVPGLGSLYVNNGQGEEGFKRRLLRGIYERLQHLASWSADLTIFQNRDSAGEFVSRGIVPPGRATIIPGSGVRTELFDPARIAHPERKQVREELGVPEDALLVTMVSRVIRSKGVEEFVAAAKDVRLRAPRTHFLLVGPADDKSIDRFSPEEIAQLQQAVNWPGARRDIPRILAATDIFVLPSFYPEGIPRVLLEAASMALPIVTTRSPGCVDVVEDAVNGLLVPVRDSAAVSAALLRLVKDPDLRARFGQESRRRAIALFDLSRVAGRTREIYRALLSTEVRKQIADVTRRNLGTTAETVFASLERARAPMPLG
jgi:glycosyltransferase involved in cell wall biosynthesis